MKKWNDWVSRGEFPRLFAPSPAKYIHSNLKIVDLFDGAIILEVQAPEEGWSIQSVCNVKLPMETKHGADAYLDDLWLTSTEV